MVFKPCILVGMAKWFAQKYWHELFEIAVALKGFNGIWETISGLLFLLVSKATLAGWLTAIFSNELLEDPSDNFIQFLSQALQGLSTNTKTFAALYILFHGLLNIYLAVELYRDRHWAYLVAIGAMLAFIPYQLYRISLHHSLLLAALTLFDGLFIILTWHEYKYHRDRAAKATLSSQ